MFIARQPIFNKSMKIYGYELLFRSDINALQYGNTSSLSATASVFGSLFEQGIDKIIDNEKAFVNFDYDFIMSIWCGIRNGGLKTGRSGLREQEGVIMVGAVSGAEDRNAAVNKL